MKHQRLTTCGTCTKPIFFLSIQEGYRFNEYSAFSGVFDPFRLNPGHAEHAEHLKKYCLKSETQPSLILGGI